MGGTRPTAIAAANAALVATLVAFFIIAVRALAVAHLDPTTAVAIVQTTGPVHVLVGTLTWALPEFAFLLVLASIVARRDIARWPRRHRRWGFLLLGFVAMILVFVADWFYLLIVVPVVADEVLAVTMGANRMLLLRRIVDASAAIIAFLIAVVFFVSSEMWLPQEKIELLSGSTVYGYVLEEDGPWVSLLQADRRRLLLVREDEIEEREPCTDLRSGTSVAYLLRDLFGDPPMTADYRACPR